MNNRRTLILLVLAILAVNAINFFLSRNAPAQRSMRKASLIEPGFTVNKITITRPDERATVLVKENDWSMLSPNSSPVENERVLKLLDALADTTIEDSLSENDLLRLGHVRDGLGLADSPLTVALSGPKGEITLAFGNLTPTSNGVYVAVGEMKSVQIVSGALRSAVDLHATDFRQREIFPFDANFVLGFDSKCPDGSALEVRREGELWMANNENASAIRIREFLHLLSNAVVTDFLWPNASTNEAMSISTALLSGYGLDAESALSLVMRCADGTDRRILFGNRYDADHVYALVQNGSAVVTMDADVRDALARGLSTFSDQRAFPVDGSVVSSFTIMDQGTSYILVRDGESAWCLDSPIVAPADTKMADETLQRILSLNSADFSSSGGLVVSLSTNQPAVTVSPERILGKHRLADFRSLEILHFDSAFVRRLVSTPQPDSGRAPLSIVFNRETKSWMIETENESNLSLDKNAVEKCLKALSSLRAREIVTLKPLTSELAQFALDKPIHMIGIDLDKEGTVRRNLLIGKKTKGGSYATIGSSEAVFIISDETANDLTRPWTMD